MRGKIKFALVMLLVLGIGGCKTQKPPTHGIIQVPDDFTNIQEALDFAWTGDTVLVAPGEYRTPIQWPSIDGIVLLSVTEPESTCINSMWGRAITISTKVGTTTVINGFKISGYGGIYCKKSSPTISGNIISDCATDSSGGGIYCKNSNPIIRDNIITDNSSEGSGGGIYCENSSPQIIGNTITNNTAHNYGGAIYCDGSNPTISGNTISHNTNFCGEPISHPDFVDTHFYAGIFLWRSSPIITNNDIVDNRTGIFAYRSGSAINHNTITDNDISGILVCYSTTPISYNTISRNNWGIEFHCFPGDPGNPQIYYNNIVDNASYGIYYGGFMPWVSENCPTSVNAEANWWGDASGPSGEGSGSGDRVTICVDYTPWLTSPVDIEKGTSR